VTPPFAIPASSPPRIHLWLLAAAATLCAAVPVWCFYPGLMNADTFAMYAAALLGPPVPDWHAPFLIYCWRGLIALGAGPAVLTAIQSALWFAALASVLALRRVKLAPALLVLLAALAFPPTLPFLATIEKTSFMAVALAGCFAVALALERAPTGRRTMALRAALVVLALAGTWARPNGALLFLPLAVLAGWRWRLAGAPRLVTWGGVVLFVAVAVSMPPLARVAGLVAPSHPEQPFFDMDLFNLTLRTGEDLMPPGLLMEPMPRAVARLTEAPWTSLGLGSMSILPLYGSLTFQPDGAPMQTLRQAWVRAVLRHPLAYLRYRWAFAGVFNCVDLAQPCPFCWHWQSGGVDPNPFGIRAHPVQPVFDLWRGLADTWVFRPIVLVGLVLAVLALALLRRRTTAAAFAAATLLVHAGNLVLTASPDPRLCAPLVLLLPLLAVDTLTPPTQLRRRSARSAAVPPPAPP
jgi:hypothetical protein